MPKPKKQPKYNYVRLADAYQLIGKSLYDDWVDYEICMWWEDKWQVTNLSPYIQPDNNQSFKPQLFSINLTTDNRLVYSPATAEQESRHNRVKEYLFFKLIQYNAFEVEYFNENGEHVNLDPNIWADISGGVLISVIESIISIHAEDGKTRKYRVLVEPATLKYCATNIQKERLRNQREAEKEANYRGAGRKPRIDKKEIIEIGDFIKAKYPALSSNKSARARLVAQVMEQRKMQHMDIDNIRKIIN